MLDDLRPKSTRLAAPLALLVAISAVGFGLSSAAKAQNSAPKTLQQPAPRYLGPPPGIDGPEVLLTPLSLPRTTLPTGESVPEFVVPEESLPGGTILDDLPGDEWLLDPPQKLSAYKSGFFQKLSLQATWMGNSSDPADLGLTEFETFVQVGLPAPIIEWPLLVTPGFNLTMIDGPTVTDLPSRLYLAYVDLMWLPQIVRGYTLLLSVVPSVFSDFDAHEFRLTGKSLLIVDIVPERLQFVGGVLYLNRDNIRLLPAGGFIWSPAEWTRFELIFPKPKLAVRINTGPGFEDWVYTTAEFGGNTFPIIRTDGVQDNVTYNDYRILTGFERKLDGGAGYRLEAGYVFGRTITFTSGRGDFDPQHTLMLRGGITY